MVTINPDHMESEMSALTIAGHTFDVADDPRFIPGATIELDEGTASTLQQVRRENIRNNFAAKIKGIDGELTNEKLSELQRDLHAYAEKYRFGVRAAGSGGRKVADPVEREALRLIRDDILAAYKAKHNTTVKGEALTAAVGKVFEAKGDDYMRRARRNLRERESLANALLENMAA